MPIYTYNAKYFIHYAYCMHLNFIKNNTMESIIKKLILLYYIPSYTFQLYIIKNR